MCGITGKLFHGDAGKTTSLAEQVGLAMTTMVHRGPDDAGSWIDQDAGVGIGFRRLAILDLSETGHQPMLSATGRYVISFNGEVYNFGRVRDELEAAGRSPGFRGHSDTEVMLAAIEAWGLFGALERFVGMFAFALWDRERRCLHLVRDRMGVKPLYYGSTNDGWVFGSELKALKTYPGFDGEIDRNSLALFLRHNYIPAPHTIYRGVFKCRPGTVLTFQEKPGTEPSEEAYWSLEEVVRTGLGNRFREDQEREAGDELNALLLDAVNLRMISDVPLGVFLSGGIDSSLVTALMQAQSNMPVRTFSIGFREPGYDEARYAADVARHLGTDHTELYVTPEEAMRVIPALPAIYDEPFADSSQIPTFLVSRLARTRVTVALSGDGGDELFGGYNRYLWARKIWNRLRHTPLPLRTALGRGVNRFSPSQWERLFRVVAPLLPPSLRHNAAGDKMAKVGTLLSSSNPHEIYVGLVSHWPDPSAILTRGQEYETILNTPDRSASIPDYIERMMFLDSLTYLPDDILVKVDRASMAVSLEAREPLLDHRLVELSWRLPTSMKVRGGEGKWLLRQVLHRYVPKDLVERPKMGFAIPIDAWLRGPLREWADDLLAPRRLADEGFFAEQPIREKWNEHLAGRKNWQYLLWDVLMFQGWLDQQRRDDRVGPGDRLCDELVGCPSGSSKVRQ